MDKYKSTDNDQFLLKNNRFGVSSFEELRDLEAMAFAARATEIVREKQFWETFSEQAFKKLHFHLFQDVYHFAGEYRNVQLAKGNTRFCQAEYIASYAADLFEELTNEPVWRSIEEAADRLAYFKTELNLLHPFREGNGRTIRIFIHAFALSRSINWQYENVDREEYMHAMIQSVITTKPLYQLFLNTIAFTN
ncbi:Fic/DOC family protein [Gracilibacillus kekensis]|uniref:protein adenylyltransferase n=1 Tax=Gracilibacillus kekensis TaxID=1027249 RepID=A0A1M7QH46_9BACI|nr:Fic family protein [Gracilibacillus kekensis]SHN30035.1 cell filamentation protein [Gracilibacillus kekensis]